MPAHPCLSRPAFTVGSGASSTTTVSLREQPVAEWRAVSVSVRRPPEELRYVGLRAAADGEKLPPVKPSLHAKVSASDVAPASNASPVQLIRSGPASTTGRGVNV